MRQDAVQADKGERNRDETKQSSQAADDAQREIVSPTHDHAGARIGDGHVGIDAAEKRPHHAHERRRVAWRPRDHRQALLELLRKWQVDRSGVATAHGRSAVRVGGDADHGERDLLLPRLADPGRSEESNLAADRELGPIEGLTGEGFTQNPHAL